MKIKAIITRKDPAPFTHIREAITAIKLIKNGHKPKIDNPSIN